MPTTRVRITIEYNNNQEENLNIARLKDNLNKALTFSKIESLLNIDSNDINWDISRKFELITKL